jgi:TPR repeat protein
MLAKGQGCTRDQIRAAEWYQRAADRGFGQARLALEELRRKMQGIPPNDNVAPRPPSPGISDVASSA